MSRAFPRAAQAAAVLVLAGLLWLAAMAGAAAACATPANAQALREGLGQAVNAERRSAGLAPLAVSRRLTRAAQGHACSIARRDRVTHRGTLGAGLRLRLTRVGYHAAIANENLAMGLDSPAAAVAGWMGSPHHRANLLSAETRDFGAGIAQGTDGRIYWVAISARHR